MEDLAGNFEHEKYEYDLGMSTTCIECDRRLQEGQMVWANRFKYKGHNFADYYCSDNCAYQALEVETNAAD